ncbi:hypothetical protein RhiTH_011283 [Rhizoctonia solani]
MEPEPTIAALLEAVTALTATVRSLQAQITSQGQQLIELKTICKETANLLGNKDQGGQAQPGPLTGPITPPNQTGGETNSPGTVRPGLKVFVTTQLGPMVQEGLKSVALSPMDYETGRGATRAQGL